MRYMGGGVDKEKRVAHRHRVPGQNGNLTPVCAVLILYKCPCSSIGWSNINIVAFS